MRLRLCTWNVNSVRLRAEQIARFVGETAPDVLCLQEIKCREGEFPYQALADAGLPYVRVQGQKGLHGVAIASRLPLEDSDTFQVCKLGHARCVSAVVEGVEVAAGLSHPHHLSIWKVGGGVCEAGVRRPPRT